MKDLLTVIDHLELALQHSSSKEVSNSLAEGVELTLKELKTVLEKNGLISIDALGKPFDPSVHHAMSQVESDAEENTVVSEFRKGYMFKDRVVRAALVGVAKKQTLPGRSASINTQNQSITTEEN
jgi:molecular chaperone GrpE